MENNTVKYEVAEKATASVHDDTEVAYAARSRFTSLGGKASIAETPELPPYTMEELNARIDEAEEQIARGEIIDADEADREIEKMFALWA